MKNAAIILAKHLFEERKQIADNDSEINPMVVEKFYTYNSKIFTKDAIEKTYKTVYPQFPDGIIEYPFYKGMLG